MTQPQPASPADLDRLRAFYGDGAITFVLKHYPSVIPLLVEGWTVDGAMDHIQGKCDQAICTGNHDEIA